MAILNLSWSQYLDALTDLANKINRSGKKYTWIHPIPMGGVIPAFELSQILGIPVALTIDGFDYEKVLIVDDICDSGATLKKFAQYDSACLFVRDHEKQYMPTYNSRIATGWVTFPWEKPKTSDDTDIVVRMLETIGEDPTREGLKDTPRRVVKMWNEMYRGYDLQEKPKITVFDNNTDGIAYDQMIFDTSYFFSQCEHHIVPFFGDYYFAYIPDKKILGLSKVARIVDFFSAKLQVQERLVKEILDEIEQEVKPKGCALMMKGRHLCKEARGVKKIGGNMITTDLRGCFKEEADTRNEFLNAIKLCE